MYATLRVARALAAGEFEGPASGGRAPGLGLGMPLGGPEE